MSTLTLYWRPPSQHPLKTLAPEVRGVICCKTSQKSIRPAHHIVLNLKQTTFRPRSLEMSLEWQKSQFICNYTSVVWIYVWDGPWPIERKQHCVLHQPVKSHMPCSWASCISLPPALEWLSISHCRLCLHMSPPCAVMELRRSSFELLAIWFAFVGAGACIDGRWHFWELAMKVYWSGSQPQSANSRNKTGWRACKYHFTNFPCWHYLHVRPKQLSAKTLNQACMCISKPVFLIFLSKKQISQSKFSYIKVGKRLQIFTCFIDSFWKSFFPEIKLNFSNIKFICNKIVFFEENLNNLIKQ